MQKVIGYFFFILNFYIAHSPQAAFNKKRDVEASLDFAHENYCSQVCYGVFNNRK